MKNHGLFKFSNCLRQHPTTGIKGQLKSNAINIHSRENRHYTALVPCANAFNRIKFVENHSD